MEFDWPFQATTILSKSQFNRCVYIDKKVQIKLQNESFAPTVE